MNAVLWDKPEEIEAEMRQVISAVKTNGGYIFSSDDLISSSVSLEDFRQIIIGKGVGKLLRAYVVRENGFSPTGSAVV